MNILTIGRNAAIAHISGFAADEIPTHTEEDGTIIAEISFKPNQATVAMPDGTLASLDDLILAFMEKQHNEFLHESMNALLNEINDEDELKDNDTGLAELLFGEPEPAQEQEIRSVESMVKELADMPGVMVIEIDDETTRPAED
jgi:hypothetical protein